jgi:hypothetical protein
VYTFIFGKKKYINFFIHHIVNCKETENNRKIQDLFALAHFKLTNIIQKFYYV